MKHLELASTSFAARDVIGKVSVFAKTLELFISYSRTSREISTFFPSDLHTTESSRISSALKYLVPENQLSTANLVASHFTASLSFFLYSRASSIFIPPLFLSLYLTFWKIMYSIERWSTCLNLLADLEFKSITRDRPSPWSTSTTWQTKVQDSPCTNDLAISLTVYSLLLKASRASLADFSVACF